MGLFLTFSIIKNKIPNEAVKELENYVLNNSGGLEKADVNQEDPNFCSLIIKKKDTIITYPEHFTEYFQSSEHLSLSLKTTIYTFNIYDGDYWILYYYKDGELISRFNPYPTYWKENEDRELMRTCNFNVADFSKDFCIETDLLKNYFTEWTKVNKRKKAYSTDNFEFGNCMQVFDLLDNIKINYTFPISDISKGLTYKLWTHYFPNNENDTQIFELIRSSKRYTKNYIKLIPAEIEYLFDYDYENFIECNTKNQLCLKCNKRDTERENLEMYLSIEEIVLITKGFCKNCGKAIDKSWGIQNLKKLYEILNK